MKGYITSKDYSRLYELVEQGYRIAGWIDREFDKDSVNAQKIKTIVKLNSLVGVKDYPQLDILVVPMKEYTLR
jgi:hypothetical protein